MTIAAATAENSTRAFTLDAGQLPHGAGFSTAEEVNLAASWLGLVRLAPGTQGANRMLEREARYRLSVSPGSIQLHVREQPAGWEPLEAGVSRWLRAGDIDRTVHGDVVGWTRQALELEEPESAGEGEKLPAAPSRWWSDRSRSRMVRALSTVDWSPIVMASGCRPAMVTLTYPGDWLSVAPDSAAVKRHWSMLRRRLGRLYESNGLEAPGGVWKLEFQRRGAPHLHIYMPVPVAPVKWRHDQWSPMIETRFQEWLSEAWSRIVGARGEELERHRRAGTGVDFSEGSRMSDPRRLAVYFVRHNAKGSRSKAYQHKVPEGWESAGRWWGTFGVDRLTVEAECSSSDLLLVRRTLRAWVRSQQVKGAPRVVPQQVRRGVTPSGVQRRRWVSRRYRIRSLEGRLGGFVVVNDGPAMAAMLARALRPDPPPRLLP